MNQDEPWNKVGPSEILNLSRKVTNLRTGFLWETIVVDVHMLTTDGAADPLDGCAPMRTSLTWRVHSFSLNFPFGGRKTKQKPATDDTEPSSNVAPRTSGRKIDGSLLTSAHLGRRAYVTCDATAFPVPVFR